jgi:predicted RNA-binding Zn-ribbon protein involved in translation (DUF1610 family)
MVEAAFREKQPSGELFSFTCPKCGGHAFGAVADVVTCQQDTLTGQGACGFSGPYDEHIRGNARRDESTMEHAFTCPECGAHEFTASRVGHPDAVVMCSKHFTVPHPTDKDGTTLMRCGWFGSYPVHVKPLQGFATASGRVQDYVTVPASAVPAVSQVISAPRAVVEALERQVREEEAPERPVLAAIRDELKASIEAGPLTLKRAREIARNAQAAAAFIKATSKKMEDYLAPHRPAMPMLGGVPFTGLGAMPQPVADENYEGEGPVAGPIAYAPPAETFGTRIIQECMAALPKILDKKKEPTVKDLVESLVLAKKENLSPEVQSEIRARLGEILGADKPKAVAFGSLEGGEGFTDPVTGAEHMKLRGAEVQS